MYKMDKEENWLDCYKEIYASVKQNHRGPSKHRVEEHRMVNWMKYNRKKLNSNKLVDKERTRFLKLVNLIHSFNRVNQYC